MRDRDMRTLRACGLIALAVVASRCGASTESRTETLGTSGAGVSHHEGGHRAPARGRHDPPASWHAKVTIENQSHWAITQLFLAPLDGSGWGEAQLGANDRIGSGRSLEIGGIDCDSYDMKLVDEAGDECIIEDVDLCVAEAKWVLHDKELIACERKTARSSPPR